METHHHAHHDHGSALTHVSRTFIIGIVSNFTFVIIEFITGFSTNSLSLMSDAGHNLSDVATLLLSLLAFQMAKKKATNRFTYGYQKTTILASLINAIILLIAVGSIGWESIQRFMHPQHTSGETISLVAGIGIAVNGFSAFLFFKDRKKDLNIKGAYLHLALDAMVSLGVVLAGLCILWTKQDWIDPLISLMIMIVVIYSTWGLLTESVTLSMDGVPSNVNPDHVKAELIKQEGLKTFYHIHIWAIGTNKNAMTAHLVFEKNKTEKEITDIKRQLKHSLEHLNIQHITFETELHDDEPTDTCTGIR